MITWVSTLFSMRIQCKNSQIRVFLANLDFPLTFLPKVGKNCVKTIVQLVHWQGSLWCLVRGFLCLSKDTYMVRTSCHLVKRLSSQPVAFVRWSWSSSYVLWSIFYLLQQLSYLKLWRLFKSHSVPSFSLT